MIHIKQIFKLLLCFSAIALSANTLYVDNNAGDGFWPDAYSDLSEAIAASENGDQIWVAAGIYKPASSGERNVYFTLRDGIEIYGGFVGGENSLDERDPVLNETVLSGDIGVEGELSDNSYHVIFVDGNVGETTILDGFTIRDGMANHSRGDRGSYDFAAYGGGLYIRNASPHIRNCHFTNNYADVHNYNSGGAVCLYGQSASRFENCRFTSNSAKWGGAFSANDIAAPVIDGCEFTGNQAVYGGAYEGWRDTPEIRNTVFRNNTAEFYGGAVTFHARTSIIDNCLFESNTVTWTGGKGNGSEKGEGYGGAVMYMRDPFDHSSHAATTGYISNSTFVNNTSQDGSAVGAYWPHQKAYLDSCMVWNNTDGSELNHFDIHASAEIYVSYTLTDAGPDGEYEIPVQSENITYISLPEGESPFVESYVVVDENADGFADAGWQDPDYVILPPEPVEVVDISPIFEGWINNGDGTYKIYFGYETRSTLDGEPHEAYLEAGTQENKLTGYSDQSVLVENFAYPNIIEGRPGRTDWWPESPIVIEDWDGEGNIVWTLAGRTATASLDPSLEKFPSLDISPIFDGWVNNGDGTYSVYFGYENRSVIGEEEYTAIISAGSGSNRLTGYSSSVLPDTFSYPHIIEGRPGRTPWWPGSPIVIDDWDGEGNIVWTLLNRTSTASLHPSLEKKPDIDIDLFFEAWKNNGDGTFTAYFGYDNHTTLNGEEANAVLLAGSNDNYFSDGLFNEHLPNVFIYPYEVEGQPGRTGCPSVGSGISVPDWDGQDLEWHVNGQSVTATLDPEFDITPTVDISPIFEGWTDNGDGVYTAYFGYETRSKFLNMQFDAVLPAGSDGNNLSGYDSSVLPDTFKYSNCIEGEPGRTPLWPRCPIVIEEWDGSDIVWTLNGKTATASLNQALQHDPIDYRILVVDNNPDDGSWDPSIYNVYTSLSEALQDADEYTEIWVAAGTYTPDGGDRNSSFTLVDGVRLFGGFKGGETQRDQRDPAVNFTVLSGDIGDLSTAADNCYHVIRYDGYLDTSTVLDGFTITGGNADHDSNQNYNSYGGGLLLRENASPVIANCIFTNNRTGGSYEWNSGGAVALYGSCEPLFKDCVFEENTSDWGGAVSGNDGSYAVFEDCQFLSNAALYGGAYEGWRDNADFTRCEFRSNTSSIYGGAVAFHGGVFNIDYCLFDSNVSAGDGAALAAMKDPFGSSATNVNSVHNTFVNNQSETWTVYVAQFNTAVIDSAMFWNNTDANGQLSHISPAENSNVTVSVSAFEDDYVIPGSIEATNLMYYSLLEMDNPFNNDTYYIIDHRDTGIPEYGWLPEGLPGLTGYPKLKIRVFLEGACYNHN